MAQQLVNIGAAPNDGTGDPARTAFDKLNDNDLELYGHNADYIDAGTTQDLTAVITAAAASNPCVVRLRSDVEYDWPVGVDWPLGVSLQGAGYDEISAFDSSIGAVINSTGRVVQALGAHRWQYCIGVHFTGGLQIRKQRTILIGCRTSGAGMLVGGTSSSPYYSRIIGHRWHADTGATCLSVDTLCNAVTFDGALFLPDEGRGIDFIGTAEGNAFRLTMDFDGSPAARNVGAIVYFSAAARSNDLEFVYWEPASIGKFKDGAHIVFANGGSANRVRIQSNSNGAIRVYHKETIRTNYVDVMDQFQGTYKATDLEWTHGFGNKILAGTATSVYLPPTTLRQGTLQLQGKTANLHVFDAYVVTGCSVNAAGSGGTNGTYYQECSDANTVTDHEATIQLTVAGGVLTAATLLYPGWNKAAWAATYAVTAATGLTGGVINLTSTSHEIDYGGVSHDFRVEDYAVTTFMAQQDNTAWVVSGRKPSCSGSSSISPGAAGNATIAHGQTQAPGNAWVGFKGDTVAGGSIFVEVQSIDTTNITVRFKDSAGADVTTGGPYTVSWFAK